MLIPRFSLRLMLTVTTACAVFFFLVMLATQGRHWAIGVSVAVGGLILTMLLHVSVFGIAWLIASILGGMSNNPERKSPFASAGPPEQIIPPTEPE
jgi:hypothetical protein